MPPSGLTRPPVRWSRRLLTLGAAVALLAASRLASGAVKVELEGVDGDEEKNVEAFLSIYRERESDKLSQARVRRLHELAHEQIQAALGPFGRYGVQVEGELTLGADGSWVAKYRIDPGPPIEAPHGRAAAVATGVKRARPGAVVFTYQGDGDLAAIVTAETLHAANRGELFTIFFINNAVHGMTGGQMAPTTLLGQKTTTSPAGRSHLVQGYHLKFSEVLAQLEGTSYIERVAVNNPPNVRKTKQAIIKGFEHQLRKTGFSMVEILSTCPTNWRMGPLESCQWIDEVMNKEYPLGVIKEVKCS